MAHGVHSLLNLENVKFKLNSCCWDNYYSYLNMRMMDRTYVLSFLFLSLQLNWDIGYFFFFI